MQRSRARSNMGGNVVSLAWHGNTAANESSTLLLNSARRISKKMLSTLINNMFNNADDCLFEYADKAENNRQQSVYLDAMREIRIRREAIFNGFFTKLENTFYQPLEASTNSSKSGQGNAGLTLSLIEEDALEESLAVTNMEQRVYTECRESLSNMVKRINEVCEHTTFTKESTPLGPAHICNSFNCAAACLSSSIEIKIIVFKLFDKFVIRHINEIYSAINDMFIAAGVLPTIKYSVPKNRASFHQYAEPNSQAQRVPNQDTVNASDGMNRRVDTIVGGATNDVFASMQQSLHHFRNNHGSNVVGYGTRQAMFNDGFGFDMDTGSSHSHEVSQNVGSSGTGGVRVGSTQGYYGPADLLDGLSQMQQKVESRTDAYENQFYAVSGEIKGGVIQEIQALRPDSQSKGMRQHESDIIDIVSMMFDFILKDKDLPDSIKLQLSKLQIPYIKIPMIDSTFFNNRAHSARLLLNELSSSYGKLDTHEESQDSLQGEVIRVVESILNDFKNDIGIFDTLLAEFRLFIEKEVEVNKLVEDIFLAAKMTVSDELEKRLANKSIPDVVKKFLIGPWKDVLRYIGSRDDCSGPYWDKFTDFIDDLVWSIQPKLFAQDRKELTRLIPGLLDTLIEGASESEIEQECIVNFYQALESLHLAALRVESPGQEHEGQISFNDRGHPVPISMDHDSARSSVKSAEMTTDPLIQEMLDQSVKNDAFQADLNDPMLAQSPFFSMVKDMSINTWVEFYDGEGKKRGKLAWKCDFTGDFLFMSRLYKVVNELSMRDLIIRLENGTAFIVDEKPLFDRAMNYVLEGLNSVMPNLQQPKITLPL